jgi:hypothetical protein
VPLDVKSAYMEVIASSSDLSMGTHTVTENYLVEHFNELSPSSK